MQAKADPVIVSQDMISDVAEPAACDFNATESGTGSLEKETRVIESTCPSDDQRRTSSSQISLYVRDGAQAGQMLSQSIIQQNDFNNSVVTVKCTQGYKAAKMFFGTMSSSSWASQAFVNSCGLKAVPIQPHDLIEYYTVDGSTYTPTHYIEVWLRDDSRNMKEFVRHSFNITPDMGGIELVAGLPYIIEHKITLGTRLL